MTIERRSPLPVGRYWQDLIGGKERIWHALVADLNSEKQRVQIISTEEYPPVGDAPARTWVLFRVLEPVYWDHIQMGSPTIATPDVQTSDDTVTKPEVQNPLDTLTNPFAGLATPAKVLVWSLVGVAALGGVALIWKLARPKTRVRESGTRTVYERIR